VSGVFGIVSPRRAAEIRELAGGMTASLAHGAGVVCEAHIDDGRGLVLGRSGIGVFNAGPQPVWNEDRTVAVVLSGELYGVGGPGRNGHDASDEERLLAAYSRWGEDFALELNGTFQTAIWDAPREMLVVANDRLGLYPLYYVDLPEWFAFAPQVRAILADPQFVRRVDPAAVAEYIRFQHLLADRTFFENVRLLPNGSVLSFDVRLGRLTLRRYWDFDRIPSLPAQLTFDEAVDEAGRLLRQSVERRLEGPGRVGVYLSGGLDSRVILGMIGRQRMPVPTVTFGRSGSRDVVYAGRIARAMGSDHHWFEWGTGAWVRQVAERHLELTEGFHSWIHAHGLSVLDRARQLMDVNLTGFHGQELNWEDPALIHAVDDLSFDCRLFELMTAETTWPSIDEAEESTLYTPRAASLLRDQAWESLRRETARVGHLPPERRSAALSFASDRRFYLYYAIFHRSRIEQRFPFCDYEYFDFVHALPPEWLFDRRLRRAVILRWMRPLGRVPYDKDNLPITDRPARRLGAQAVNKGKAFVNRHGWRVFPELSTLHSDYEGWLRTDLRSWAEDLLFGDQALSRGLFRPEAVRSLWHRLLSGMEPDIIGKLAPIMTLEMLLRQSFEGVSSDHVPFGIAG
jgi:asparagine synthase (glutamine-hydrolysing)